MQIDDATVCPSIRLCLCACACMHLCMCLHAFLIFIVHAGPEAAVLDWYGTEADPGYWQGGKGGRIPGNVWGWGKMRFHTLSHRF